MTHQQRVGLLVIGVAVVLVAAIAVLRPQLVSGAAQAASVPAPPVVGDCVFDPVLGPPMDDPVTAASGGTVPVYPAQRIGPCTAARYGEVTAVIAAPKPAVVEGDDNYRYLHDPNRISCIPPTTRYVGMTAQPIQRFWQTNLQINLALSRPSPRQAAAGQRWAACIGGCRQPHALEVLAYGDSGDHPVARVQVEQTCQQAVRQLTAMPDPTAAGALSIQINVQDGSSTAITTPQVPAHSYLGCGVAATGHHKLRGSLLALGRQPIPWA